MAEHTLRSFVVVLNFAAPGPLTVGAFVAPDKASAAAMATVSIMQQQKVETPLQNILVVEETAEHLRLRLHAIEGKPAGEVVSLVRKDDWPEDGKVTCYGEEFGPPMPPETQPMRWRRVPKPAVIALDYGEEFGPPMPRDPVT